METHFERSSGMYMEFKLLIRINKRENKETLIFGMRVFSFQPEKNHHPQSYKNVSNLRGPTQIKNGIFSMLINSQLSAARGTIQK